MTSTPARAAIIISYLISMFLAVNLLPIGSFIGLSGIFWFFVLTTCPMILVLSFEDIAATHYGRFAAAFAMLHIFLGIAAHPATSERYMNIESWALDSEEQVRLFEGIQDGGGRATRLEVDRLIKAMQADQLRRQKFRSSDFGYVFAPSSMLLIFWGGASIYVFRRWRLVDAVVLADAQNWHANAMDRKEDDCPQHRPCPMGIPSNLWTDEPTEHQLDEMIRFGLIGRHDPKATQTSGPLNSGPLNRGHR